MSRQWMRGRWARAVAGAGVAMLALTGCAGGDEPPARDTETAESAEIADTPVGMKTQWIIDVLEADEDTTASEWEGELHESFLAEVSAQELADLLNAQIRPARPFTITSYEGTDEQAVTSMRGTVGEPFDMSVAVDADDRIVGLFFGPASDL
ncbi:Cpe/LpqF family protein [Microbacterium album]|uniref:ORF 12 gene product N-terminal domain-containing protein n=1 Tax=Microbacterium album TaxID=2053191 RepID=A0A917IEJ9_9MICO|nr:Cpe/LpqF family protein [Microbacterium album]GGH45280.1 hypothetical protein GCM10010921_20560 [Microbacterium album]